MATYREGKVSDMNKTKLMAILNLSADSFYPASRAPTCELALARVIKLQQQGADILDIGGCSARPGAKPVSEEEELQRVVPILEKIKHDVTIEMSIDTTRPSVAKIAIDAGATIINDISALSDPNMIDLVKSAGVDVCIMHMRGTPLTMQHMTEYEEGIVEHLMQWFKNRTQSLIDSGIDPKKIIIDPGIGFAKSLDDNFMLLNNLKEFHKLGFRVLVGTSRKSFMGKAIHKSASQLLAATLAVNTIAVMSAVDIIRVHDVEEHRDIINLLGPRVSKVHT